MVWNRDRRILAVFLTAFAAEIGEPTSVLPIPRLPILSQSQALGFGVLTIYIILLTMYINRARFSEATVPPHLSQLHHYLAHYVSYVEEKEEIIKVFDRIAILASSGVNGYNRICDLAARCGGPLVRSSGVAVDGDVYFPADSCSASRNLLSLFWDLTTLVANANPILNISYPNEIRLQSSRVCR